jgi:hexosaminidase
VLQIKKPLPNLILRYTTNGSLPVASSPVMSKPLVIKQPVTIKLAAFTPTGLRGEIYTLNYQKEVYREPVRVTSAARGLQCKYYKKYLLNTLGMKSLQPDSQFIAPNIVVPALVTAPSFGLQYSGYIDIPETGIYSFYLLCDDGGTLTIGNKEVVNNDGQHAPQEKSGQIALKKGLHPFYLNFIEGGGGFTLQLKYSKGNGAVTPVPDSFFKH